MATPMPTARDVFVGPFDVLHYREGRYPVLAVYLYGFGAVSLMFGAMLAQCVLLAVRPPSKSKLGTLDRTLIGLAVPLGLALFISDGALASDALITDFGSPKLFYGWPNYISFYTALLSTVLISAVCQTFYAVRAWRLQSRNLFFGAFLVFFQLAVLALGLTKVFYGYRVLRDAIPTDSNIKTLTYLMRTHFGIAALYDLIVCCGVVIPLLRNRKGFNKATDSILHRTAYVCIGGAGTTCCFTLVLFILTFQSGRIFMTLFMLCPLSHGLYINCLLFAINSRDWLSGNSFGVFTPASQRAGDGSGNVNANGNGTGSGSGASKSIAYTVQRVTKVEEDVIDLSQLEKNANGRKSADDETFELSSTSSSSGGAGAAGVAFA